MAEQSQADRKEQEAHRVALIARAIGFSSVAVTGVLSVTAAVQGPDSLLFQSARPARAAGYDTSGPTVTEVVIEMPVPSPLPPTHVPAAGGGGGGVARSGGSGGGGGTYYAPPAPGAPPPPVVKPGAPPAPRPTPTPVPVVTSTPSVPH